MTRGRAGAFSLIELLVVISIIAVLAAMLLPVIRLVKEASLSTKCQSNLRQIGMAASAYAADSDGMLPPVKTSTTEWATLISPYVEGDKWSGGTPGWGQFSTRSILKGCPKFTGGGGPNQGYAMNSNLVSPSNLWTPCAQSLVLYPSGKILVGERTGDQMLNGYGVIDFSRHSNRTNAVFCDGHIQSLDQAAAFTAYNYPANF